MWEFLLYGIFDTWDLKYMVSPILTTVHQCQDRKGTVQLYFSVLVLYNCISLPPPQVLRSNAKNLTKNPGTPTMY